MSSSYGTCGQWLPSTPWLPSNLTRINVHETIDGHLFPQHRLKKFVFPHANTHVEFSQLWQITPATHVVSLWMTYKTMVTTWLQHCLLSLKRDLLQGTDKFQSSINLITAAAVMVVVTAAEAGAAKSFTFFCAVTLKCPLVWYFKSKKFHILWLFIAQKF